MVPGPNGRKQVTKRSTDAADAAAPTSPPRTLTPHQKKKIAPHQPLGVNPVCTCLGLVDNISSRETLNHPRPHACQKFVRGTVGPGVVAYDHWGNGSLFSSGPQGQRMGETWRRAASLRTVTVCRFHCPPRSCCTEMDGHGTWVPAIRPWTHVQAAAAAAVLWGSAEFLAPHVIRQHELCVSPRRLRPQQDPV